MFDGNYRTQRRVVNLSGKRKTDTSSKQAVLDQARFRREERRRLAAEHEAATTLQSWFRGCTRRNAVAQQWKQELQQQFNTTAMDTIDDDCVTPMLDAWLGLKTTNAAASKKNREEIMSLLQQYAIWLESASKSLQQKDPPTGHRIISTSLQYLQDTITTLTPQQTVLVLSYCLDVPLDREGDARNSATQHFTVARTKTDRTYYLQRVGEKGFMLLVELFCGTFPFDDQLKSFLYKCIELTTPDNVEGRAMQAVLILTTTSTVHQTKELLKINLSALLQTLAQPHMDNSSLLSGTVKKIIAQHSTRTLLSLVEQYGDSTDADELAIMIQLLRMLLLENVGGDEATIHQQRICLLWTLNRAFRGDNLESRFSVPIATTSERELLEPESDDDEEDQDTRVFASSVTVKTTTRGAAYRLTKHELQTTAKLDRLFASQVKRADETFAIAETMSLVAKLSDSSVWLHWANVLLITRNDSVDTAEAFRGSCFGELTSTVRQAQTDFVRVLAAMMQGTTGLRPGQNAASSSLLNKFAFSSEFLEGLWGLINREFGEKEAASSGPTYAAASSSYFLYYSFSLFSDLFAHNLIALRDNQFLARHTKSERSHVPILAQDIISRLQILLYEIYWTKPVRADDFRLALGETSTVIPRGLAASNEVEQLSAIRARLLLSGTKLWNSLYERWCRLVRPAPFCEESTWWFPSMVSLTGDSVVMSDAEAASSRRRGEHGQESQNRPRDVDDERFSDDSDMENDGSSHPVDPEADALAEAFSDPMMARILAAIPQALPFDRRVKLFDALLRAEKSRTQNEEAEMHEAMLAMMRGRETAFSGRERVEIHRDRLYVDSMRQLNQLGPKLKRRVQVSYINQYGAEEAGIDGGGVFKEFIDDLIRDAFTVENTTATHQLFTVTPLQTLKVNSDLPPDNSLLVHFEFLGRVLGKAVYESILVEPQFCLPFLNQLLGKSNSMEDLKNYDPEYYRNLTKLLALSASELASMGLTFEMTVGSGVTARTVELMPGGRTTEVTKQNVVQYIHFVSHQQMNVQSARQTRAFLNGFRDLIPASWVRLFSAYELQKLISGDDSVKGIDVGSLKRAMHYAGGYHPDQPVVRWFWEIVYAMNADQQKKLLKFMTSCSRQPLLGFASLDPAPCIQQIRLADALFQHNDRNEIIKRTPLPTSSTCMNLLKLPHYRDKELMRQKLLAAIESGAGFELT